MMTNRIAGATAFERLSDRLTNTIRHSLSASEYSICPTPTRRAYQDGKVIKRILVPLDGTAFAEHAIPPALEIAQQCDAVLHLVHVLVPTDVFGPFEALHSLEFTLNNYKMGKKRYLSDLSRQISATAPVCVATTVVNGVHVGESLHETFGASTDLVVMASHGRGAIGRFWWGSVAHSLLQRTTLPLVLVRGDGKAVVKPRTIDHVVLPIGDAKQSEQVVELLLNLGLFAEAQHTLLHVTRPEPALVARGDKLRTEWIPSYDREVAAREILKPLTESLTEAGRQVEIKIVNSEKPVWQVVSRYARHSANAIVVCTYRRGRLLDFLVRPKMAEQLFRSIGRSPLMLVPT